VSAKLVNSADQLTAPLDPDEDLTCYTGLLR